MERNIFDAMVDAFGKAILANERPVAWNVNEAALQALIQDTRVHGHYSAMPLEDRSFMGIPFAVSSNDRAKEWRFSLAKAPYPDRQALSI